MKSDARSKVLKQYGETVVEILDRYAAAMCKEAAAYYANDRKARQKHAADLELLHEELEMANGPIGAFWIEPRFDKVGILWILIQSYHDLDERIDRDFDSADGVLTSSEATYPWICVTKAAAPKVIKVLEDFYPGVIFVATPTDKYSRINDESSLLNIVLNNWNEAITWMELPR